MGPRIFSDHKDGLCETGKSVDKGRIHLRSMALPSDLRSLTCGICQCILNNPMQLISCGCRFCQDCIQAYILKNGHSKLQCPIDEEEFTTSKVKKDKGCMKEIEQLEIECQSSTSCGWKGPLSKLQHHTQHLCPNTMVTCSNNCGQDYLRRNEFDHMDECPRAQTQCTYCRDVYPKDQLEAHYQSCPFYPISCNFCNEKIPTRNQFSKHLEVCTECELECPMAKSSQCKYKGKRADMTQHVVSNHVLSMVEKMVTETSRVEALEISHSNLVAKVDCLQKELKEKDEKIDTLEEKIDTLDKKVEKLEVENKLSLASLRRSAKEIDSPCHQPFASTERGMTNFTQQHNSFTSRSPPSPDDNVSRSLATAVMPPRAMPSTAATHMMREMVDKHENQIFHLHTEMQAIQQNFSKCSVTLDDLRLRQDIQDVRTTNGTFIWKIPDIRRRYRDALEGKTVSLYSPPFRSSPHGYRMCMRIYLNGDGTGKGTYVSLFFVLMKSEHDDLLSFPFRQSVRFTLINQETRTDSISEAFAPDLNSQSFQKPKSDMNVASGFPKFAKQAVLHNEKFTKGNAIYIKAQVDLNGLTLE